MKTLLSCTGIIAILFLHVACQHDPPNGTEINHGDCDTPIIGDTSIKKGDTVVPTDDGFVIEDSIGKVTPPPTKKSCRELLTKFDTLVARYARNGSEDTYNKFYSIRDKASNKDCWKQDSSFLIKFTALESKINKLHEKNVGPPSLF
jgi:hypothetical protein